jgi:phospholipase/carboxylesterase
MCTPDQPAATTPATTPTTTDASLALGCELARAKVCVVSLHGRFGTSADGLALGVALMEATFGPAWQEEACVRAPQAAGNKWYPHSFLFPRSENEPRASESIAQVRSMLTGLRSQLATGGTLVLAGFSQGACLACEVLAADVREERRTLAGAIAFTGGLMGDDAGDAPSRVLPAKRATSPHPVPVALITGDPDTHVPVQRVHETAEHFRIAGLHVALTITPGKRHVVLPSEMQLAGAWMREHVMLRAKG